MYFTILGDSGGNTFYNTSVIEKINICESSIKKDNSDDKQCNEKITPTRLGRGFSFYSFTNTYYNYRS